jgi:arsenate reductase (thioredoxin)
VTQRSYNVLFVCADNSICSTMAEAILKRSGLGDFHAFSAGVRPRDEMKPVVADFLKAHGIWHQEFASTGCSRFLATHAPRMDFIISLGEQTPAGLPAVWPGDPQVVHWHITSPIVDGDAAQRASSFRKVFMELENRIRLFVLVNRKEGLLRSAEAVNGA